MTMALVILIILLTMAYFYLKCSVMNSLSTFMLTILATFISMSYYEVLAELFVSRGYAVQWAHFGCFLLAFILSFALLRALRDLLVGGVTLDLGNPLKATVAIVCGLLTGALICGNLLIAIGLTPVQHKLVYSRFNANERVSLSNPNKSFLNTDGLVAGLYSLVSRGSLQSGKSFAVLHADYLDQIALNRLNTKDNVLSVTSRKSLQLPKGNSKKPVRIWDIPDQGRVTVVRMELVVKNIQDGGAGNPGKNGQVEFSPGQIRLICKSTGADEKPAKGKAVAVYPIGFLDSNGQFSSTDLETIISKETRSFKNRPYVDVVFDVPQGMQGVFLQFKQNAVIELPPAVETSDEIERTLEGSGESEEKAGT